MTTPSADSLRSALREIKDPRSGQDIVAAGLLEGIHVRDGMVQASLLTDRAQAAAMEPVRRQVQEVLARQPGVRNATVVLTAHKGPAPIPPRPAPAGGHGHSHGPGSGPGGAKPPLLLPDVKAIVAVASGKGGVGKSTVAVNLAVPRSAGPQGRASGRGYLWAKPAADGGGEPEAGGAE